MPLRAYIKAHYPKAFSTLKNLRSFLSKIMENTAVGDNQDGSSGADTNPPFDPSVPAVPISYPLQELEELESRSYFKSFHYPFNRAAVKLPSGGGAELPGRPRILVCHDMAGGYTDDKFAQGGTNPDAYAIWHWYLIDVFVYFSHSLVTLPPPCWTNAAHRHGVKVLGTFIMEWDEGKERADKLLSTKDSAQMYAERLTELAVALGFDGWLLNMEVTLDPEQIPNLKAFVSHLSQTMHSSVPESLVIWYDSVTIDGDLSWQNQLNDKNKPFFDLCDGIFVNYSWKEDFPKLSAGVAGDRKFDVYMGIDVFGRGTFGGGQWTTNVALNVIKKDDVSAAIFAPGWVYETNQPPDFQTAQNRWWGLVEKSWGTVQKYPKALPFYSNFDQGHGYHIYSDGKQVSDNPWNNISSQSFQPFLEYSGDSTTQPIQVSVNFKEASYNGGGNITFTGTFGKGAEFTTRLFQGEVLLGSSPVYVTYSVKSKANSLLGFALEFSSATEEKKSILLAASGNTLLTMNQFSSRFASVIMPRRVTKLEEEPGWIVQESSISMPGHILKEIRVICNKSRSENSTATSEYYAVLGDIKITTTGENSKFPPSDSWLVDGEFVSWTSGSQGSKHLSVKIVWQLKVGNSDHFPKYNVYVEKVTGSLTGNESRVLESANEYVGVAVVKSFYVSDLEVPSGTSGLKFIIQVCGLDGTSQKIEDCPFLLLQVQGS
ncbi:Mannosyl-glycoprotein endo-beta-N-acetylglucosaminidase [Handroanthus impetiginosus]|uniref:mannosyl-glycoprotein endo-beta-N-acetylglucosaminidase n=1 Tax=Handroanthus impetiginosus TaxID=429701 RepID=A0A2G9HST1_9LAMI|nr:Mannosyl-glycoprotein endo-beta-N-acetylglucosaminidase [Handroanthus impetiginosus]